MAAKMHVKNTIVMWDSAGGTTFVALADLFAVKPVGIKTGFGESTVMESTGGFREFLAGFREGTEPTMKFRLHKTQYTALMTAAASDVLPNWKFKLPIQSGETVATFGTVVAGIAECGPPEKSVEGENVWECEVTLKPTGVVAWTAGS